MRIRRLMIVTSALLAVTGLNQTEEAWSQGVQHQRAATVPRDTETRVNVHDNYTNSGAFCVANGVPTLSLTVPPKNGTVRFAPTKVKHTDCPNETDAVGVFYRPNPGFVGQDQVVYEKPPQGKGAAGNEGTNIVNITVK